MERIKTTRANITDRLIISCAPLILGIFTATVVDYFVRKSNYTITVEEGMDLIKTIIDIWGILLGFVITAVSILLTIGENSYINALVETNHMKSILFSYVISSVYLLLSIIFSLVLLIVRIWNTKIFNIFIGLNVCILISIIFCIYFLFAIVLRMDK